MTTDTQVIALNTSQARAAHAGLDKDWHLDETGGSLTREFRFKGYARALHLVNLAAWLASEQGHHPDIEFGWGYCRIRLTTHDAAGLSPRDFQYASALDQILLTGGS